MPDDSNIPLPDSPVALIVQPFWDVPIYPDPAYICPLSFAPAAESVKLSELIYKLEPFHFK